MCVGVDCRERESPVGLDDHTHDLPEKRRLPSRVPILVRVVEIVLSGSGLCNACYEHIVFIVRFTGTLVISTGSH